MSQLILSGVTVKDLLCQIEQLLDSKLGVNHQNQKSVESGYLSRLEVSKLLKISLPTLHDWTNLNYLTSYKIGKRVLYKESEVREALERVPSFKYKKGGFSHA